ncbi:homoserine dehydrogenase [bacterium]|nr:homoserine dehydrogenase [bacterium]
MVKVALVGFGTVGQGLVEILVEKQAELRQNHGFDCQICGIADIAKGSVIDANGLDLEILLASFQAHGDLRHLPAFQEKNDSDAVIRESGATVLVEATPTNLRTAQPALRHVTAALETGMHVVTCNKGPVALAYADLMALAHKNNVEFYFESTVMSGTPVLNLVATCLKGCRISGVAGIFNGTTNYILSEMESGREYRDVLEEAQRLGYAEADPSGDVDGWDALAKVVILANVIMGENLRIEDVERQGISHLQPKDIAAATAQNGRWKLIGAVRRTENGVKASVKPLIIPLTEPLAGVMGVTNAITFATDLLGPVTVSGAGAGKQETAFGLLNDLLRIDA